MGLWVLEFEGRTLDRLTGFRGITATDVPDLDLTVTATVIQHDAGELVDTFVDDALRPAFERADSKDL